MTLKSRVVFIGFTLLAMIGLAGVSEDADACPRRCRLFGGGLFAGRKCEPAVSELIAPEKVPPVVVEPPKPAPLPTPSKDLTVNVRNIAALFKKGDTDAAKKLAVLTAKDPKLIDEITDLMHLYRPITTGGLGIENELKKPNAKDAERVGNLVRAMAELTIAKGWDKGLGKRAPKRWRDSGEELRASAEEFSKAKNEKSAKAAAAKVIASCNRCHAIFKD